jgi:hypothetical protein
MPAETELDRDLPEAAVTPTGLYRGGLCCPDITRYGAHCMSRSHRRRPEILARWLLVITGCTALITQLVQLIEAVRRVLAIP